MIKVYVLESKVYSRRYKGLCRDLNKRLVEHNLGKTKSTKAFRPWKVVYFEEFQTFAEARKREIFLKSAAGRRFINSKIGSITVTDREDSSDNGPIVQGIE